MKSRAIPDACSRDPNLYVGILDVAQAVHCKHYNIYIADDKPSRQQHENGLRHKGNLERFVKGLYREGEKRVRERDEEKRIMASVGKAAEAAYELDVASGRGGVGDTTKVDRRPSDLPATVVTVGYKVPEAATVQQRMKAGMPMEACTPGAWTVVEKNGKEEIKTGEKRGPVGEGEKDGRAFKLRRKTVEIGLGEIYDPAQKPSSEWIKSEPMNNWPSLFRQRKNRSPSAL